ncbi:peptidyl-prolyl cis-trans isomerase D [Litoreibacter ascidiaceicola]|uniref:Parvulin-like PPIase n=1 Tax=Litoreibacter ascidiaceicola TaxID=1486859 RepID=A0A1M4W3L1_9RHOB|nr:peptidylprolyl isomerase [Litoreibacter ascidiaceicola]SHE75730.1 peptidyl-prolyl cis-trans isomerase D [Litoreibacter ascidiaceicola]
MAKSGKSSASRIAVWGILLLLVAGLAGFGSGGLGGNIQTVGSVGDTPITVQEYQRGLQQELDFETRRRQQPVSMQTALQEGLDIRVRERLAASTALTEEARVMSLSVGDAEVLRQLQQVPAFQGPSGAFDRDAYEFALERSSLRPADFEDDLRKTAARELLQQAVTGGLTLNKSYAETLYGYLGQRRSFRWAELNADLLASPNAAPTDAQLQAFYDENGTQFETPEVRKISYAWLTPDMLVDDITPNEDELLALYEERSGEFNQPERRIVERLGFADTDAATAAKAAIDAGETSYDDLVTERGLTLEDVDQGEVSRDDLDGPIADAVFALTEPGITDPVETSLGPALYRVNAVLEAQETSFEEVRDDLVAEAAEDQARRAVLDKLTEVEDLLAGGATLEELGTDTELEFGQINFSDDEHEGIAGYDNFREEALLLREGDFPEARELSDGGIFAARLDEVVPPALPPLADIRDDVAAAWDAAETKRRLSELGESLKAQLDAGTAMEALGLVGRTETDRGRTEFIEGTPPALLVTAFDLEKASDTALIPTDDGAILVELLDISAADLSADEAQNFLTQLSQQGSAGLAADVFELYGQAVQARHGLSLDQVAINAVNASMR